MKGNLSRMLGAALVASISLWMLGGCVAESADEEEEPLVATAQGVTLEPTPKVLSNQHADPAPPLNPVLPADTGGTAGEPEPQPWDVGNQENQGAANGTAPTTH